MKQGLKQINGNSVKEKLSRFLLKNRITQHTSTGIPPSELLMGHQLRSRLDLLHSDLFGHVGERQWKQKQIHDKAKTLKKFKEGDQVYAEDFLHLMKNRCQDWYRELLDHCLTIFNSMMEELFDITLII